MIVQHAAVYLILYEPSVANTYLPLLGLGLNILRGACWE